MQVTKEEFELLLNELDSGEVCAYHRLDAIFQREMMPKFQKYCTDNPCLKGKCSAEDLKQETLLLVHKHVVTDYLEKNDPNHVVSADGFRGWLHTVAKHVALDAIRKHNGEHKKTQSMEEAFLADSVDTYDMVETEENAQEQMERLRQAFQTALSVRAGIYKVLTWMASSLLILEQDVTKIQANQMILDTYEEKTLNEMYAMLLEASHRIPWIQITPQQHEKMLEALGKPWNQDITYGESKYKDFFMKQNGEACGLKSLSDWIYRMNRMICRQMGSESAEPKKKSAKISSPRTGEAEKGGRK